MYILEDPLYTIQFIDTDTRRYLRIDYVDTQNRYIYRFSCRYLQIDTPTEFIVVPHRVNSSAEGRLWIRV